jgi:hypothetical protein
VSLSRLEWRLTQCSTEKFLKNVRGKNDIEAALRRLDRLTSDEGRATAAQTLEVVCCLVRHRVVVLDGEKALPVLFFACY